MKVNIETERQHLFDVSILIAMRIHIRGNALEDDVKNAFDKAVNSHEILGMKVCLEEDGTAYYSPINELNTETIHISENLNRISFENSDWKDILHREECTRFRIEDGEFLKAFVYDSDLEGFSILFLMHHLGGDGKSLVYFIETFMNNLAEIDKAQEDINPVIYQEPAAPLEMRTIPAGDISEKALADRIGPLAIIPKTFNKNWQKDENKKCFSFSDLDEAYEKYWKDRASVVNEYVIKPEQVSKVLEKCKSWNIGFTAYITAAFTRRLGRKLDIGYAVDARIDGNRSMSNQATGISIKYAYNYEKTFRWNADKIQALLNKKLEDDEARDFLLSFMASFEPSLVDSLNMEHAGTFHSKTSKKLANLLGYGKKTKDLSITNLTRLDISNIYGNYEVDFFSFIPPVISNAKNVVGLSTLGDSTVMTIHRVK